MGTGRDLVALRKNGTEFPAEIGLGTVSIDGELFVLAMITDISERKYAEVALRESEERLSTLIQNSPLAFAMFDRRMRYVLASRRWLKDYGISEEDIRNHSHYELFPEIPERWREIHRRGLQGEVLRAEADRFERRDGTVQVIDWEVRPWYHHGELSGLMIFAEDVTYRKWAETRFRNAVDSVTIGMIMVDAGGAIVIANREAERLFGYAGEELLGQSIETLIPQRGRSAHIVMRDGYSASPQPRRMGEGRELFGLRRDGREFPVEVGLSPVRTDEGVFTLAAVVDVTERKRAEASLQRAIGALERSNIELERFAYIASHDLQTPLRGIASFAELLQAGYGEQLDDRGRDWIHRILDSVKQLQALIRDLLEYSRIDSQPRPFEGVSLNEAFDHAVALLESGIRAAGATVTRDELPTVTGDRSQLVQLLLNLLGNALKYRSAVPPEVHVSANRYHGEWQFAVSDNGIGIEAQYHERIFKMFERLHAQRDIPGTGIGLAICRRVVHRHGGRIWVESEPGCGSVFRFTLPDSTAPNRTTSDSTGDAT